MLKLPGLIDPHVHVREPGQTHKEDWDTATASALAGGVTMILAMPNTRPPIFDASTLDLALASAKEKARCDYAQFIGAGPDNAEFAAQLAPRTAGLKMYLDSTFGELRLDDMSLWMPHFEKFPKDLPIVLHSESRTMAAGILFAALYDRPVHIAHISLKEEILLLKAAKERGIKVTCEVCPHHLFLTKNLTGLKNLSGLTPGRKEVRPRLATRADAEVLWANLDVIDCFATDHAPHTLAEKDSENPPPGFPGLETILPLLLTAVSESRLTISDIVKKMHTNPKRIFRLPDQPETWVEVDENAKYEIHAADLHSRCGWTPFEGWQVKGRVRRVVLRGRDVYIDGKIMAKPGYGNNVRDEYPSINPNNK
ncbi:MAG: amidohydrolase family protein [Anaerolineales bacterium]|jgi:carbamoyl-phosphate synthase/aspartate carbamoyltransferase/dihydroorotase